MSFFLGGSLGKRKLRADERSWCLLATTLLIPAALRVRSQAVNCEGSPGKSSCCIINLVQLFVVAQGFWVCVCLYHLPSAPYHSGLFWTLEAGGVAGQSRRGSSMDSARYAGPSRRSGPAPAGPTGRWLPQDNDQVTSAEWTSHQANRLTFPYRGSQAAPSPSPGIPSGNANNLRSITKLHGSTKFHIPT